AIFIIFILFVIFVYLLTDIQKYFDKQVFLSSCIQKGYICTLTNKSMLYDKYPGIELDGLNPEVLLKINFGHKDEYMGYPIYPANTNFYTDLQGFDQSNEYEICGGIIFDKDEFLYVLDYYNYNIKKYDEYFKLMKILKLDSLKTYASINDKWMVYPDIRFSDDFKYIYLKNQESELYNKIYLNTGETVNIKDTNIPLIGKNLIIEMDIDKFNKYQIQMRNIIEKNNDKIFYDIDVTDKSQVFFCIYKYISNEEGLISIFEIEENYSNNVLNIKIPRIEIELSDSCFFYYSNKYIFIYDDGQDKKMLRINKLNKIFKVYKRLDSPKFFFIRNRYMIYNDNIYTYDLYDSCINFKIYKLNSDI
ncbi:MAG TPA: hypothetical protein PLI71_09430, partial [Clostridia bacterium]|nr:hypothetical protein [Clostridia bacterium]